MKLLMENWKQFLKESQIDVLKDFKNFNKRKCWDVNYKLTKGFTQESRFECLGIGNNKIVFSDADKPDSVVKVLKTNTVQDTAGEEVYVWEKLKDTPFSTMFAEIVPIEYGLYYMKKSEGRGSLEELEEKLYDIAEQTGFKYRDLKYYMLSDANRSNIGKIDGQSVLLDYDEAADWVYANKESL